MIRNILSILLIASGFVYAENLRVGQKAPFFKLKQIETQKEVSLNDYKGKLLLIDFWASWCAPCKISMPLLHELDLKYKDLELIAINIDDDKTNALSFLKDLNIDLTALYDSSKTVVELYNVPEMPTAYLVDQYGYIQFIHSGYKKADLRKLEFKIKGLVDRR